MGYSPWSHKEPDMTEQLNAYTHTHTHPPTPPPKLQGQLQRKSLRRRSQGPSLPLPGGKYLIEVCFLCNDFQYSWSYGRNRHHLQLAEKWVVSGAFIAFHLVFDDEGEGLGVVDHFEQGGDGHVLEVAVSHAAADGHQGLQPRWKTGIARS